MEKEVKNDYEVYEDNLLLVKFWDLEQMRDTSNYTMCAFKNISYTGNPSLSLKAYYCNSSYDLEYHELPSGFNMTGNVLLIPNSDSLNISGDEITISTWVKWNTDPYEWADKAGLINGRK